MTRVFLLLFFSSGVCSPPVSAGIDANSLPAFDTHEVPLDTLAKNERILEEWSSSDGLHVAHVVGQIIRDGRVQLRVVVDGKQSPDYDAVAPGCFSPDNNHCAFLAKKNGASFAVIDGVQGPAFDEVDSLAGIVFSQDGSGTAYAAQENGRWLVVHNGKRGPQYDAVRVPPVLSKDGLRVAYSSLLGEESLVVVDGVEIARCQDNYGQPILSNDGMHVAYATKRGDYFSVVVDGEEGPAYEEVQGFAFGPEGRRYAYMARKEGHIYAIVDGIVGPPGVGITRDGIIFSPEGSRTAYGFAKDEDTCCMIVDGEEGPAYGRVDRPYFSPDGKRIAYAARRDEKWFVVVDSLEGDPYDDIYSGLIVFSPDGSRVGYVAQTGQEWCVVVDGKNGPEYRHIGGSLVFSPDGRRYAYIAVGQNKKPFVVVDGERGPEFDAIYLQAEVVRHQQVEIEAIGVVFSPDSRHVAYIAGQGNEVSVILNGVSGKGYDWIGPGGPTFHSDGSLEYLAVRGNTLFRVTCIPRPR